MQPNYFAIIPASVRYDKDVIPNAKLLYGEISALCNSDGFCWAENSYFAELYAVSSCTISRWISQLEKKKHIKTILNKKQGNSRKIYLVQTAKDLLTKSARPIDEKRKRVLTKNARPIDEKRKSIYENNTINNTMNREEENALTFFKNNFFSEYELFCMKYKSQIKDFVKFEQVLGLKLEEEKTLYELKPLRARIERFAINYIANDSKPFFNSVVNQPEKKQAYQDQRF
jgi:hypothetical protein